LRETSCFRKRGVIVHESQLYVGKKREEESVVPFPWGKGGETSFCLKNALYKDVPHPHVPFMQKSRSMLGPHFMREPGKKGEGGMRRYFFFRKQVEPASPPHRRKVVVDRPLLARREEKGGGRSCPCRGVEESKRAQTALPKKSETEILSVFHLHY